MKMEKGGREKYKLQEVDKNKNKKGRKRRKLKIINTE
jgi:hypothetical protein